MSKCAPRKHSTEARVNGEKVQVFVFTCVPCGIFGRRFTSRAARDREAAKHK